MSKMKFERDLIKITVVDENGKEVRDSLSNVPNAGIKINRLDIAGKSLEEIVKLHPANNPAELKQESEK